MRTLLLVIPLCMFLNASFGQHDPEADSLKTLLISAKEDTSKVNILVSLSGHYSASDPGAAGAYASEALFLSDKLGSIPGIAKSHNSLGIVDYYQGNYTKALDHFSKATAGYEKTGNRKGKARSLGNSGLAQWQLGNYSLALKFYFSSLEISEEMNDKRSQANALNNIGLIYNDQKNNKLALEYYSKALKLFEEMDNKSSVATLLNNIGNIYESQANYQPALDHYKKAVSISEETNNQQMLGTSLGNMGFLYMSLKDFGKSLDYQMRALTIRENLDDKHGMALSFHNIASVYLKKGEFKKAIEYYTRELELSEKIGYKDGVSTACLGLSETFEQKGEPATSLRYYKLYTKMKDSLLNTETSKQVVEMQTRYETEKKEKEIELQKAQIAKKELEVKQQATQKYAFVGGFALMIVLAAISYTGYRAKQKANLVIARQKEEVERKKEEVEKQKEIIEEKNKDIVDSINYAQRIQRAILTSDEYMAEMFPSHFVLFKPKDIVSGDFYWAYQAGSKVIWAVADCTGHGVPGAFMSMIGNSFLNEIVVENGITKADLILNRLREKIIGALEQKGSAVKQKDGMDIALCVWDRSSNQLEFSGANNPCWIIRNKDVIELKPDKMPIGAYTEVLKPFSSTFLDLVKGDAIYTFTDGYADQFGGPKGKKFKYSQMKELLLSMQAEPLIDQKRILYDIIEEWRGELEQVDDICITGVRVDSI